MVKVRSEMYRGVGRAIAVFLLCALPAAAQAPRGNSRVRYSWLRNRNAIPGFGLAAAWDLTGWSADTLSIPNLLSAIPVCLGGDCSRTNGAGPVPGTAGLAFSTSQYCVTPSALPVALSSDWEAIVVLSPPVTHGAVPFGLADRTVQGSLATNGNYVSVYAQTDTQWLITTSHAGTNNQSVSPMLPIDTRGYNAFSLRSQDGNAILTRLDTGASVSIENRATAPAPSLSIGGAAQGSYTAPAMTASYGLLYSRALSDPERRGVYEVLQRCLAARGVALP